MTTKEKEIFTTEEAAEMMGCSPSTIEEHALLGREIELAANVRLHLERRHARAFVGLGLDLALQGVGLGRCSASAVSRRFGTALAGAGHSLQKASRRMLNARFTSMLKPSCNLDSSPMARSIAGYSTAAACELGPGSMAGSGAIATGCGATGASSSSTVLMPLAMAAAFSGACAIWLAAPCTSSRSSSSRWVG